MGTKINHIIAMSQRRLWRDHLITPCFIHFVSFDKVLLGVHSISLSKEEKNSRQKIKVKKAYHHPHFNEEKKTNDLMLLQVIHICPPAQWCIFEVIIFLSIKYIQ